MVADTWRGRELMRNTCFELAQRGFVTATITYRLGSGPVIALDAIYQAEQDAHAAIRYMIENANTYAIDTAWIFTSGESAGGNIALAMAYTDQQDWDMTNATLSATYGGLNTSGNAFTHTYTVKGVLNNWGAAFVPAFDTERDVSIISFHGEQDGIVDIDFNQSTFYGGSRWIYQATTNFGYCNSLNIDSLGGHGVYQGQMGLAYRVSKASCFFKSVFCGTCTSDSTLTPTSPDCGTATSVTENTSNKTITVFPNPFIDQIQVKGLTGNEYFIISNTLGQTLSEGNDVNMLNLANLNAGIYLLTVQKDQERVVIKLIKRR